jgi:hypothetical protein
VVPLTVVAGGMLVVLTATMFVLAVRTVRIFLNGRLLAS